MKIRSKKGFTLVEIMIVVVIIGLLAAMAIPAFEKVRRTALAKAMRNDARQLGAAMCQLGTEFPTTATGAIPLAYNVSSGAIACATDFDPSPASVVNVRNYCNKVSSNYVLGTYTYPAPTDDPATFVAFTITHTLVAPTDVVTESSINNSSARNTAVQFDAEGKAL